MCIFSSNVNFLLSGNFTADLTHFPRGAKSMESCTMIDESVPTLNLFKQKRVKGWWPFETEDGECAVGWLLDQP